MYIIIHGAVITCEYLYARVYYNVILLRGLVCARKRFSRSVIIIIILSSIIAYLGSENHRRRILENKST